LRAEGTGRDEKAKRERKEKRGDRKVSPFHTFFRPRFKDELVEAIHALTRTQKTKLRRMAKRELYGWYYRLRVER